MNQPTNEPNYTTVMIIWGAMVFAVVPNVIVAVMIAEPKEEPFEQTIIAVMCLMAVFNLALSVGIRRWASQPARLLSGGLSPQELSERQFPIPMQQQIMTWALAESATIFGLVLSVLSGDAQYAIALGVLTIGTMFVFHRPRRLIPEDFFVGSHGL